MRAKKLISTLKAIEINDTRANQLRRALIRHLESGKELPTHNNKINLSALASLMNIDRQLFYPGRGNKFFIAIASEINNNFECNRAARQKDIGRKRNDATRQMIDSLSNEVLALREELARANQIEKMALSGMHIVL